MWTTEPPLQVSGNTLPKFALLDTEGKPSLQGNPLDMEKKIEETIGADQEGQGGPGRNPDALAKTWTRFAKGDVAGRWPSATSSGRTSPLTEPRRTCGRWWRAPGNAARGKWLVENGYVAEATEP